MIINSKRVLLKISGESFSGNSSDLYNNIFINKICNNIIKVYNYGYQVCLIIGGGNICRGKNLSFINIDRISGDYMGILSTMLNSIVLSSKLEKRGINTRIFSSIEIPGILEQYVKTKVLKSFESNSIVIFASGSGIPLFTTDTAAIIRAIEMNCVLFLKGTKVDGVYSDDPYKNINAKKIKFLSYYEVINNSLFVMDHTSIILAKDYSLPIKVFNITENGSFIKVLRNSGNFTLIS